MNPDTALEQLSKLYTEFGQFCHKRGQVSETDTRVKIIDRILRESLGWPESAFVREVPVHEGYVDYVLGVPARKLLVVEAKRAGLPFDLPKTLENRKKYKISGSIRTNPAIKDAIEQAQRYCLEVPVRYAVVTNGYAWLVFRAIREDMGWRDGFVLVFPSAGYIKDHFTDFWNLLNYESVIGGGLEAAFAQEITTPRVFVRPLDLLVNPDAPLLRNRFHMHLQPFVQSVFSDIGSKEQIDVLKECYVYDQSLRIVDNDLKAVIEDSIPRFIEVEGGVDIKAGEKDGGSFGQGVKRAVTEGKQAVFLLLGGIGSGKTTFLKRFFEYVEKDFIDEHGLWYYVNFIAPPREDQAETYLCESVLAELRDKYSYLELETRVSIKEAFSDKIAYLQTAFLEAEHLSEEKFEQRLNKYLEKWVQDLSDYTARLVRLARKRGKTNVLVIDNVDQLPPSYQATIFLLAQRASKEMEAVVVIALREESYYAASIQKAFTAYNNQKFHILSPPFATLINLRVKYCLNMLSLPPEKTVLLLGTGLTFDKTAVAKFLQIIEYSIFSRNRNIARFIESLAFGNMREALEMFATFLYSGVTNVDKMLKIYDRDGSYFVAFHEFAKSVILGDRRYYRDFVSKVLNVFDCGQDKNASHFTSLRLLALLLSHINQTFPEGRGFVRLDEVLSAFIGTFDNEQDVFKTLDRLLRKQLIQVETRSTESIKGASYVRLSSAGWYYYRYLARAFAYLDLVFQDTPFTDNALATELKQLIIDVDDIAEIQETMPERMELRFQRVDMFLNYLRQQEEEEFSRFMLDGATGVLCQKFMPEIVNQYEKERDWIEDRIKRKAERAPDDALRIGSETVSPPLD
jgi:hypothetical protein